MGYDPIESAAKGAAEGAASVGLEWTEQKVRDAIKQFRNRKLAFIKDADNIELVKEERKSTEFSILRQYVPEKYIILVQMGLALRQMAENKARVIRLVDIIRRKYQLRGLHVAEIAQVGIMTQLLTRLSQIYRDPVEVIKRLTYFLDHSEDLIIFVREYNNPNAIVTIILNRIESIDTHIMILFGSGDARNVVDKVLKELGKEAREYVIERRREGVQTTAFIFTPEVRGNISHWADSLNVLEGSGKT